MSAPRRAFQGRHPVADRVGPSVVGIGRGSAGRASSSPTAGPHQRPQPPRRRGHRHLRRRPDRDRPGRRHRLGRRPRRRRGRHGRGHAARVGRRRRPVGRRRSSSPARRRRAARARVTFGSSVAIERAFRGPGGRRIGGSIEHTAPLAPGSSGGPLLDADGPADRAEHEPDRRGLLPGASGRRRARDRESRRSSAGESSSRPRLGIAVAPARVARHLRRSVGLPERDGLLVRGVEDDSPAAQAGIREGDLIVEVAGTAVTEADALQELLASNPMPFEIKVVRGTDERTVVGRAARPRVRGGVRAMVARTIRRSQRPRPSNALDDTRCARRVLARASAPRPSA